MKPVAHPDRGCFDVAKVTVNRRERLGYMPKLLLKHSTPATLQELRLVVSEFLMHPDEICEHLCETIVSRAVYVQVPETYGVGTAADIDKARCASHTQCLPRAAGLGRRSQT